MKLQPNFSWQKYQIDSKDAQKQFEYQLQSEHIQVANSVNATIDDSSFFSDERMSSFTWTDGSAIWAKTISGVVVSSVITAYPHGITGINTVVRLFGEAQAQTPLTTLTLPLPYLDPKTLLNSIGIYADVTNIYLNVGNTAFSGYTFSATIYYTKV